MAWTTRVARCNLNEYLQSMRFLRVFGAMFTSIVFIARVDRVVVAATTFVAVTVVLRVTTSRREHKLACRRSEDGLRAMGA